MRVTDEETLLVVEEELQKLNDIILKEISDLGANAVGLNGKNNSLIQAEKKEAPIDLGLVGHIVNINSQVVLEELQKDRVPVILPMGIGKDNKTYNVNADEAAANISASLKAEKMVLLTNVKGIMRNSEDTNSFISTITIAEVGALIGDKVIQQGMIPKVNACINALDKG